MTDRASLLGHQSSIQNRDQSNSSTNGEAENNGAVTSTITPASIAETGQSENTPATDTTADTNVKCKKVIAQKITFGVILALALPNYAVQTVCAVELFVSLIKYNSSDIDQSNIARFHDFANIIFRFIHIVEYIVLIVSICKCHKHSESDFSLLKGACLSIKEICPDDPQQKCHYVYIILRTIIKVVLVVLFLVIYLGVIVGSCITFNYWSQCSRNEHRILGFCAGVVCPVNVIVDMFFTYFLRIFMVVVTFLIAATWLQSKTELRNVNKLDGLLKKYEETGKRVHSLHVVFKRWFILQWLVYFLEMLTDFYFVYDSITNNSNGFDLNKFTVHLLFLFYRLFSFIIPYLCGITMNYYHRKYWKAINERLREVQEGSNGTLQEALPVESNGTPRGASCEGTLQGASREGTSLGGLAGDPNGTLRETLPETWQQVEPQMVMILETQLKPVRKILQELKKNMITLIPENPKYQFRPSIYGISIPLNESAHIMTIALAFVAFLLSLISKSVS